MKNTLLRIIEKYLQIFPEEQERQLRLLEFLNGQDESAITDRNNFIGHIVAGGFVYAKEEKKFLVLYHKDLQMYLYPGGHIESDDKNPLAASKREIAEETGIHNLEQLKVSDEELVPIDIDTHVIPYNEKRQLPEHYHFDIRYLFTVDKIENVNIDQEESDDYQWIDISELRDDPNYGKIATKIEKVLFENQKVKK